jgi:hypothetical protein
MELQRQTEIEIVALTVERILTQTLTIHQEYHRRVATRLERWRRSV